MTTGSQRGRGAGLKKQSGSKVNVFYLIIGAIVLIGIAAIVTLVVRNNNENASLANSVVNAPVGVTEDGFYYKGNPDAPIKVVKYSDYQCPACAAYVRNLSAVIEQEYIETGLVQFIYHEFPLAQHSNAIPAGVAARCAGVQGNYWGMHNILFARQSEWSPAASAGGIFSRYAGELGLNTEAFGACMTDEAVIGAVAAAGQAATAGQVPATPTFMVNGQMVSTSALASTIDATARNLVR